MILLLSQKMSNLIILENAKKKMGHLLLLNKSNYGIERRYRPLIGRMNLNILLMKRLFNVIKPALHVR